MLNLRRVLEILSGIRLPELLRVMGHDVLGAPREEKCGASANVWLLPLEMVVGVGAQED